jgi:hypothetical protein
VLNSAGKSEAIIAQWKKLGSPMPGYYSEKKRSA